MKNMCCYSDRKLWDERNAFLKNEPGKLLKTKRNGQKTNRNEAKNEAEKLLKIKDRLKNEPETNRKTNRANLLKIKLGQKTDRATKPN